MHLQIALSARRLARAVLASRAAMVATLAATLIGMTSVGLVSAVTTGVIYACVNNSSGALKIVRASEACAANWTAIQWNSEGPRGATGPAGVTGPGGATGASGVLGDLDQLTGKPCNTVGVAGTVTISYGGAPDYPVTIRCIPVAATPEPTPAPIVLSAQSVLDFGTAGIGVVQSPRVLQVFNDGSVTSSLLTAVITGLSASAFEIVSTTCGNPIAAGANCETNLRFMPTSEGVAEAQLIFFNTTGQSVVVTLIGTGAVVNLVHSNGIGGTYGHPSALGIPGNASTYTASMAFAAANSGAPSALPTAVSCGSAQAYSIATLEFVAVWVYTGPLAGYVRQAFATPFPLCPTSTEDATWN